VNDKNAALVEVNCETDFVARNKEFQKIVEEATRSCLNYTQKQQNQNLVKVSLFFAYHNEDGTFYMQNHSKSSTFLLKNRESSTFLHHFIPSGDDCQSIPVFLFFINHFRPHFSTYIDMQKKNTL
jgi:hypothetical protein